MSATELFLQAIELDEHERERFLQQHCGDNATLRAEVERLIANDCSTETFRSRVLPDAPLPSSIGPFAVKRLIGAGGMGDVYEALQTQPIERRVAIKVVRPSISTQHVLERFQFERETLARMEHPNITRILDAGQTEAGAPYFAMEFIDGVSLREYCDTHRLSQDDKLDMFEKICAAVEHAHQRGVIHRDLKPGNILVLDVDGHPEPKIIDFGIARAVEGAGTTRLDERPGTPGYMSPEQREARPIDTRSDVYSLGVLLHELVLDRRPPAMCVGDPGWTELPKECGDLRWIVERAMQRDAELRYPGASALLSDVRAFRDKRPLNAHPGQAVYRFRRFVQRHQLAVSAALLALVSLVVFSFAMTLQSKRLADERDRVAASERRARDVLSYLTEMFVDIKPEVARGRPPSAKEMLDRGARSLGAWDHDLSTRAWLEASFGGIYRELGDYPRAEELLERAVATQRDLPNIQPLDRSHALHDLGALYVDQGRLDDAAPLLQEALQVRAAAVPHPHRSVAQSHTALGLLEWERGELDQAQLHYEQALSIHEQLAGEDGYEVAVSLVNLSNIANGRGDFASGGAMLRRALSIFDNAALENDPHLADCLNNLGIVARRQGDTEAAISYLQRATDLRRAALGVDHPDLALSLTNLGSAHWSHGNREAARRYFEEGLEIRERVLPANHPHIAFSINALAVVHKNLGDFPRARSLYERGLTIARDTLGDAHPDVARIFGNLGNLELEVSAFDLARAHYERAHSIYVDALGDSSLEAAGMLHALGSLDLLEGNPSRAKTKLERALQIRESTLGRDHPLTQETAQLLGNS